MELSDILDTPSPLIRVNACMYEYMPHMYIFVTALSNIPLCMFPHGLYSLLDYEINLSYLILSYHIIALKASGHDCTNNNELLHKIGVLQRYAMQLFVFTSELLQSVRWRSKYNGCTQRILKQS